MAELTVFLKNGATYHFTEVENVSDDNTYLVFDYYGQTTMKKRHAMFDLEQIAGYALDNEKVKDDSTEEKKDVKVPLQYREHIDFSEALDDVINDDSKDEKKTKELSNRLYTAIVQDYMEKNGSEIDEDKLGNHFVNLICEKILKELDEEEAKAKELDF